MIARANDIESPGFDLQRVASCGNLSAGHGWSVLLGVKGQGSGFGVSDVGLLSPPDSGWQMPSQYIFFEKP